LLSRLKHYEALLREHGIDPSLPLDDASSAGAGAGAGNIDASGTDVQHSMSDLSLGDSGSNSGSVNGSRMTPLKPPSGQFLSKGGKSLYLEKYAIFFPSHITEYPFWRKFTDNLSIVMCGAA
jgi:hypothetical protein